MKKVGSASAAERQAAAKEVVEQVKSSGVTGLVVSRLVASSTPSCILEGLLPWGQCRQKCGIMSSARPMHSLPS